MTNHNLGDLIDPEKNQQQIAIFDQKSKITYKQLDNLSNIIATKLVLHGIQKGDRVSLSGTNSIEFVAMHLAILKCGAVSVLINENLPQQHIDYIKKNNGSKMSLKQIKDIDVEFDDCNTDHSFDVAKVSESDPAVILYTSGTTNLSKGVILPHSRKKIIKEKTKNHWWLKDKQILSGASLCHNAGLGRLEFSLSGHSSLTVIPKFNAVEFISIIEKNQITDVFVVPAMLAMLLKEKNTLKTTNLKSVENIITTGAPFHQSLSEKIKTVFAQVKIVNTYGTTELGNGLFGKHKSLPTPDLSVGYPLPWNQYRIVDGVLEMKTPTMFLDYDQQQNKNITEDGYFITNDRFEIDHNGFYYYLGRSDSMFICGGHNIFPESLEMIISSHPAVDQCCVVGVKDQIKDYKPHAFVSLKQVVSQQEILDFCKTHLPLSHCPRQIHILDCLPLNSGGKIDRHLLKQYIET
jgi:long-chain acyl-CoA synthetase